VGYAFGKKLSIQAGLNVAYKDYDAGEGDYHPKSNSYWDTVYLKNVEAFCKVLEIPVTANYNLLTGRRHHLFVSAGFASLIMTSEEYEYQIETQSGAYRHGEREYSTHKFEPFSTMLLSAGYSFSINRKFSVFAAPYLKLPLYGVGEGSVKINSTGASIGLQYNFLETGKKK
jgi:hypothetical protein